MRRLFRFCRRRACAGFAFGASANCAAGFDHRHIKCAGDFFFHAGSWNAIHGRERHANQFDHVCG